MGSPAVSAFLAPKAVGLLGPSRTDKSTLILPGFLRPSSGRAHPGPRLPQQHGPFENRLHAENDSFVGEMTAVTFLRQMAELSGLPPKARSRRRTKCCSMWGSERRGAGSCEPTRMG